MVGELHAVGVSVGLETSTYKNKAEIPPGGSEPRVPARNLKQSTNNPPTLEVFPTYQAGVDVDVGERDGAKFLKVEIQHAPNAQTPAGIRGETLILASL